MSSEKRRYGFYDMIDDDKYPKLSFEDEQELFKKIKNGDKEARERIILSNIKLVISIANHYGSEAMSLEDLVEEGIKGLIIAVDRFDLAYNGKFSTFATIWIRKCISSAVNEKADFIRIPVGAKERLRKLKDCESNFINKYGHLPSVGELSKISGLTIKDIVNLKNSDNVVSSNTYILEDVTLEETFVSGEDIEESVTQKIFRKEIKDIIDSCEFSLNEKNILYLYYGFYGEDFTEKKIASIYNVSRENIRLVLNYIKKKLILSHKLDSYLFLADNLSETKKNMEKLLKRSSCRKK